MLWLYLSGCEIGAMYNCQQKVNSNISNIAFFSKVIGAHRDIIFKGIIILLLHVMGELNLQASTSDL